MTGSRRAFLAGAGGMALGVATIPGVAGATPSAASIPLMTTRIADSGRAVDRGALARLAQRERLQLQREPRNDYDPLAVAVLTASGAKVGYVPRARAETLANLIDAGFETTASVHELRGDGARPELIVTIELQTG